MKQDVRKRRDFCMGIPLKRIANTDPRQRLERNSNTLIVRNWRVGLQVRHRQLSAHSMCTSAQKVDWKTYAAAC